MSKRDDGGWRLPEVIDPPRRCLCIPVPNDPAHRQAFFGALTQLGYWFNWQRDAEHKAVPVSSLWMDIVLQAMQRFYSGDEYMCFTCEQLTECLEPLLDAKFAAQTTHIQQLLNLSKYGDATAQPGVPMTTAQRQANLAAGSNPSCDWQIVCAQAQQVVEYLVTTVTAVLNAAENATNTTEFLDVIMSITGLDELSFDAITGYVTFVQESISDGYVAAITPAYIDAVTCEIYCRARINCEINVDMLYDVFKDRLEAEIGGVIPAFATLVDLFQFLYGVPVDSTIIADVMHLIVLGGGMLANTFLGDVGAKPLQTLLALAADEPSNDCEILCTDCPEPPDLFPVIDDDPCLGDGNHGGTNIRQDGDFWLVDATPYATGYTISIKASGGQEFILTDITFPVGFAVCQSWFQVGTGCVFDSCSGSPAYAGETITSYLWTTPGNATVRFKMSPAP